MEVKKKNLKKIIVVIAIIVLIILAFSFWLYKEAIKYCDTHTWATLQVGGTVMSETADAVEDRREVLQGDTYHLHNTKVVIVDITHNGEVTMKFEPAVINSETDEQIETIVIGEKDILDIEEVCSGSDSASWQFRVVSHRYQ